MKGIFKPTENPYVIDTVWNRYKYWKCRKYGCITVGGYYGMAQATCSRCGGKNSGAISSLPKWRKPD